MSRLFPLFVVGILAIAGALWFAERPGRVEVEWLGYAVEAPVWLLFAAVAVLCVLAAFLYGLWRGLVGLPARVRASRGAARLRRGEAALAQGMAAVAAGEATAARRLARRARDFLDDRPLTLLLAAQAAQLGGADDEAAELYERLAADPDTAFLGVRGQYGLARRAGDAAQALAYARQAQVLRPDAPWATTTLFEIETDSGQWDAAARTLEKATKHRLVAAPDAKRRRAVLLLEKARETERAGGAEAALGLARDAHRLVPDLVPANVCLAGLMTRAGRVRQAEKLIESAWAAAPHPDLAAAYAAIHPDEPALDRARRMERLARRAPTHDESRLAVAEAGVAARLWGEARAQLDAVIAAADGQAPGRAYRLMADVEDGEHGDAAAARDWLRRAAAAPPPPAWICAECGTRHGVWRGRCESCNAFDSLAWRESEAPGAGPLLPVQSG